MKRIIFISIMLTSINMLADNIFDDLTNWTKGAINKATDVTGRVTGPITNRDSHGSTSEVATQIAREQNVASQRVAVQK